MKKYLKQFIRVCSALWILAGISGCYFTSENPLPMKAAADKELLGCWRVAADSSDEGGYVFIFEDQAGWLQFNLMEKYYANSETYRGFCSEINGEKYLSVKQVIFGNGARPPELEKDFYLLHYRVMDGKRIVMTMLNEALAKQSVKTGKLAGVLSPQGDDLHLQSPTEQLVGFISSHSKAELLGEPMKPMEKTNQVPGGS